MEDCTSHVYCRNEIKFKDFQRFKLSSKTFDTQYSDIYRARLEALREEIMQRARAKWAQYKVLKLSELAEKTEEQLCIVIGTLYKHQELKPSILRELSEELQITPQPARSNYASFKDMLYLEDETLRVKLVGNHVNTQDAVTGLVCAILGCELENGTFLVSDWCYPGCCLKPSTSAVPLIPKGRILLISGLDLTNNTELLSLSLLSEWISGMSGCKDSQEEEASIVAVVIAGNSVRGSIETYNHKGYYERKDQSQEQFKETAMAMHRLDKFLQPIVECCSVILMPGEFDPTCHTLPQQPLHPCILPQTSRMKTFYGVTNPWIGIINSRIIAGSSGQPIVDIMKIAGLADLSPLTWLERTLHWRHMAPTAPDTLATYPYSKMDPFIMTECPDIYFVGNMNEFDTKLLVDEGQMVRLICVPKFSKTQTGVLINLQDLNTSPISFGVG